MPPFLYCCELGGSNSDARGRSVGSVNERSELSEIGPLPVILFTLVETLSCQCDGWEPMIQDLMLRCKVQSVLASSKSFRVGI